MSSYEEALLAQIVGDFWLNEMNGPWSEWDHHNPFSSFLHYSDQWFSQNKSQEKIWITLRLILVVMRTWNERKCDFVCVHMSIRGWVSWDCWNAVPNQYEKRWPLGIICYWWSQTWFARLVFVKCTIRNLSFTYLVQ